MYGAFNNCSNLTSVTIGDSVTNIGDYAFNMCSSLTNISIPDSVTSIGAYAFYNCGSLTSVTIGKGVTSIGAYAFYNCSSLMSVTFKNTIGWQAGSTSISNTNLSKASTAAMYLANTFRSYTWTRS